MLTALPSTRNTCSPRSFSIQKSSPIAKSLRCSLYRAHVSVAVATSACRDSTQICDRDDPRCPGKDHGLAPLRTAMGVQVSARQENHGEDPVDDVQDAARRVTKSEDGEPRQSLDSSEAGHDQVAGAKPAADVRVPEIPVRAPDAEDYRERDQRSCEQRVEEDERVRQLVGAQHLLAEIVDGQAQALFEIDLRLPAEIIERARIVERDSENVALAPRAIRGLELVVGEEGELAEELVDGHRDTGADVIGAVRSAIQRRDVGDRYVGDVQHVS